MFYNIYASNLGSGVPYGTGNGFPSRAEADRFSANGVRRVMVAKVIALK